MKQHLPAGWRATGSQSQAWVRWAARAAESALRPGLAARRIGAGGRFSLPGWLESLRWSPGQVALQKPGGLLDGGCLASGPPAAQEAQDPPAPGWWSFPPSTREARSILQRGSVVPSSMVPARTSRSCGPGDPGSRSIVRIGVDGSSSIERTVPRRLNQCRARCSLRLMSPYLFLETTEKRQKQKSFPRRATKNDEGPLRR